MILKDGSSVVLDGTMSDILEPHRALVIHRRTPTDGLLDAVAAIDPHHAPAVWLSASRANAREVFDDACLKVGYPAALAADVGALATEFGETMGAPGVSMRLEPVATDSCRRFHADYTTVRLLVTYVGRGTEWRHAVGDDDAIRSIATGDVALVKGRLLLDPPTLLHRSPPIAGTGEPRLLLAVDAVP